MTHSISLLTSRRLVAAIVVAALFHPARSTGAPNNPNTDWLKNARYGVFMHFLPGDAKGLERVRDFDVASLAAQLESASANYLVLTLGQNSGYMNSPNPVYDRITGYKAGRPSADEVLLRVPVARRTRMKVDLAGSHAVAATAATAQTDFDIQRNGTSFATMMGRLVPDHKWRPIIT